MHFLIPGNIRVFARVRPVIPFDAEQSNVVELDDSDDTLLSITNNGRKQVFTMDKVFGPQHTQADVSVYFYLFHIYKLALASANSFVSANKR